MRKLSVLLALVALLALMLATVSAQTVKCITPKQSAVNLRGHHEQNADKVGTLAFGSQLQIVRKFNRWYEVQHNGGSAWVADWVVNEVACAGAAQSQPESQPAQSQPVSQPAQSQPPAEPPQDIDNCCFVDRQCATEQEWAVGYWDFQDNRCNAPAQSSMQGGGRTFYEFFGHQTMTSEAMLLTRGNWNLKLTTAAQAIVRIGSVDIPECLSHSTSWVTGWATRFQSVQALAWKNHNRLGGDGEARGQITVHRDCNVSFYVYAPLHPWSLQLRKS